MDEVSARIEGLRNAFGQRFGISYAMKCNPNPAILAWMRGHVDTLDVSSAGELRAGLRAGWAAQQLSFTGPAKQRPDLELAVQQRIGEVVIESLREARLLDAAAAAAGMRQKILVRIAPAHVPRGFGSNMSGKPTQFGVDEEDLAETLAAIARLRHLHIVGFHAYSGTQCLKAEAVAENWLNFLRLFEHACESVAISPEKLIFGSGLGIRYHDGDAPVDLDAVAAAVTPSLDRIQALPQYAGTRFLLETGRYLVGEAGLYVASVVHTKTSRGSRIVVLDGGMNHHLGAAGHLGMVIHRPYRMDVIKADDAVHSPLEAQDLYGPLCTTIDTLGRGVKLPRLTEGDLVAVQCSGAYGPSSSPSGFISHPPAGEFMVTATADGTRIQDCSVD
ncbi:MAG: alanine racemase [Steroidobacteraceae bacterium]